MSELGNLSQCMVDSDAAAKTRARWLRRKALLVSVALQIVVIAVVVLSPLATLGVLSTQEVVVPVPRFHVEETRHEIVRQNHTVSIRPNFGVRPLFQPPVIPHHVDTRADSGSEPPDIGLTGMIDPGVPGGLGDGPTPIEIAQPRPQTRTVTRSGTVMEALLVNRVKPEYPSIAKTIGLSGTVLLRAVIGTDGEVHSLEVLSGNPILAQAAYAAVRQWRYRPTQLDGQAVEVETQITVNFVLE
jgi:TonB family protein